MEHNINIGAAIDRVSVPVDERGVPARRRQLFGKGMEAHWPVRDVRMQPFKQNGMHGSILFLTLPPDRALDERSAWIQLGRIVEKPVSTPREVRAVIREMLTDPHWQVFKHVN